MAVTPPAPTLDVPAPNFRLLSTDDRLLTLDDVAGARGTVIAFICNHCPYVKAIVDRLVADATRLRAAEIGFAAICSNDAEAYPDDSFDNMRRFAAEHRFAFPYLHDPDQSVARTYGAVCTPDFFGFDAQRRLQYRGRLDAGRKDPPPAGARRDLVEAMLAIAATGIPPAEQWPSMGCSIKWRSPSQPDIATF